MRRLIVTGDDFGASAEVNEAIVTAHRQGVLTSASLMVTGRAWREAVELARRNPALAVGLHLVLLDGFPVLDRSQIPQLVDSSGAFRSSPFRAGLRYALLPRARRQLRAEIRAQLCRFRDTGLELAHVDGHHHFHLHPAVLACLAELAGQFGIPAVRLPKEEAAGGPGLDPRRAAADALWSWIFGRLRRHGERVLTRSHVAFADRVYGLQATGRITEPYLLELIPRMRGDTVEVYAHPARGDGERELAALVSPRVRSAIDAAGFALGSHLDLGSLGLGSHHP